ncbi:hypothetical protein [Priestia aryabhattai]|uniref:hypothetical protein n=1 Tax=Priestia aryabhattai TaxID=412384 RepID=UPI000BFC33E5|nr:hypothetical protein [Priestia aryabhattai]PHF65982.1 hypothetical protein COI42_23110 [Priestia aryabhattai]
MTETLFDWFGITQSSTNYDNFKIAFWSGLLSTLLISILVGLFLLWLENKVGKKLMQSQHAKETIVFKGKVTTLLRLPPATVASIRAEEWLPSNYLELIKLISDSPIHIWKSEGKKDFQGLLQRCEKISNKYEDLLVSSKTLNLILHDELAKNASYSIHNAEPILGLINNFKEYTEEFKKGLSHKMPLPVIQMYEKFTKTNSNKELVTNYQQARQTLLIEIESLKKELFDSM